jgi:hypothetical protein
MRFYLFQTGDVGILPPNDYVKTWNYKKYKYRLPKDSTRYKVILYDLIKDYQLISAINIAESSYQLTNEQRFLDIKKQAESELSSFEVEGQRLCETKVASGVIGKPFILGCYFIDSRGFCSCNFSKNDEVIVLVPRASVRDIATFDSVLVEIKKEVGPAYNPDGTINVEIAKKNLFDDFYFDVDEFINTLYTDNEKFGYERRLANSLKKFKSPVVDIKKV